MDYDVVPKLEKQGIVTEALGGLIGWLETSGRVQIIRATTLERHFASVRILQTNDFTCLGVSPWAAMRQRPTGRDAGA